MAPKAETRQDGWTGESSSLFAAGQDGGFDVTCVVGRVEFDQDAGESPYEAAMRLIARHDAPGSFRFPMVHGGTCLVDVSWNGEPS